MSLVGAWLDFAVTTTSLVDDVDRASVERIGAVDGREANAVWAELIGSTARSMVKVSVDRPVTLMISAVPSVFTSVQ